jgi:hypothetical protein
MAVLVATTDGYHVLTSSGERHTNLAGHAVESLVPGPDDTWLAIVDRRELRQRHADETWTTLAVADTDLSSLLTVAGVVFAGTFAARLLRLEEDKLVPVESFDRISNRDEWHQVGPALNVRSMTTTCDEQVLLANVHVGGIERSTDLGETWEPTIDVGTDVHEVRAHPTEPSLVMAAAAVGLCVSEDAGRTWSVVTDGLPTTYARAVNYCGDDVLVSISDGPWAERGSIYRRPVAGGVLERVDDGLGDRIEGNVDTRCLAVGRGRAALADGGGTLWVSASGIEGWTVAADGLGSVTGVSIS